MHRAMHYFMYIVSLKRGCTPLNGGLWNEGVGRTRSLLVMLLPQSGLFITLSDEDTLNLYLDRGIYGELREPVSGEVGSKSMHYAALADKACARSGTHIFFFHKRHISYGGQIIGSEDYGSFSLNGPYSPLGRETHSDICWDESSRRRHTPTQRPGVFIVKNKGQKEWCQPYLIRFEDELGIKGNRIESDELYKELSFFNYPVASNSILGMSFCTMTPGETDILLNLLSSSTENVLSTPIDNINITGTPTTFNPTMGISHLRQAKGKFHHDASILANPDLLPPQIRPRGATICRKIPITPFKPFDVDRADICYYSEEDPIKNGTLPNTVIDTEWTRAGNSKLIKMVRYIKWLQLLIPNEVDSISFNLLAPEFRGTIWKRIPPTFRRRISLVHYP